MSQPRTRDAESIAKIQAAYYIRHKDRILKRNADYRESNRVKLNADKLAAHHRKQRQKKAVLNLVAKAASIAKEIVNMGRINVGRI